MRKMIHEMVGAYTDGRGIKSSISLRRRRRWYWVLVEMIVTSFIHSSPLQKFSWCLIPLSWWFLVVCWERRGSSPPQHISIRRGVDVSPVGLLLLLFSQSSIADDGTADRPTYPKVYPYPETGFFLVFLLLLLHHPTPAAQSSSSAPCTYIETYLLSRTDGQFVQLPPAREWNRSKRLISSFVLYWRWLFALCLVLVMYVHVFY